jgi:hypothetical protein
MTAKMPCPRFEFRWKQTGADWTNRVCEYSLVLPLREFDCRREREDKPDVDELYLLIGTTNCSGGKGTPPITNGEVDTPFRDHAHAYWDREALGEYIPIISVCGDAWSIVPLNPKGTP